MGKETEAYLEHKWLADQLGLPLSPQDQDWGIQYGSADRFVEFLSYYLTNPRLSARLKFHLAELIFSSANEWLQERQLDGRLGADFVTFVGLAEADAPLQYEYWLSLDDSAEFPVADLLRAL